ncbi:unnamed protein product [Mesocestoides corti]|uniref:GDP-fucose protein O-fucosyltransferase 2 n=1 Tax=Mesocestoides corti TaxID=53468 RepID=A0A0R3UCD0_MESCO|nr:unnamed protein product [Mesocestoides corti]
MRLCVIVLTLFEFSVWNSYPTYCLSLNTKYLFYGVNKHEGFNLRRDVYIRIANLVRNYNWILVLPPWSQAFHWDGVSAYPWSTFFDVDALRKFIPVIEHHEFLQLGTIFCKCLDPFTCQSLSCLVLQLKALRFTSTRVFTSIWVKRIYKLTVKLLTAFIRIFNQCLF